MDNKSLVLSVIRELTTPIAALSCLLLLLLEYYRVDLFLDFPDPATIA
jgi:hypothetical protein